MIKKLLSLLAIFIITGSVIAGWYWNEYKLYLKTPISLNNTLASHAAPQNNIKEYLFSVNKGERVRHIAENLKKLEIIEHPEYFRLYARLSDKAEKIKAGEYVLKSGMTIVDIIDLFVSGRVNQYSLTIVEGWTLKEALEHINNDPNLLKTSVIEFPLNEQSIEKLAKKLNSENKNLEGLLYPDTYKFPKGTSDFQFIKRSFENMNKILAEEWANRDKETPLKSAYEALILASIVEKESGISSERSKIAGVFIRRMKIKMRLQSDPTIIYGMGDRYKGNIRRKDINEKTAYNTYQISRLPPTPISIPGREAIHAVLHPDKGKSLYFVADGTGGHVFTNNLKAHNKAVRNYLRKMKNK
ncbi:MAG: endolytic transglycosylase MltG [Gammaproteobacteria bacterium]|nr:endolytic transglycosylase MltG [Gammaproteobacteria bacterium]